MPILEDRTDDFAPGTTNRPYARIEGYLERIALALEKQLELGAPAFEINALQLNALKAQFQGGIIGATIAPGPPPNGGGRPGPRRT